MPSANLGVPYWSKMFWLLEINISKQHHYDFIAGSCLFQICATFSGLKPKTHKTFECHVTDFGYGDTMKT